jgi:hypothetical protein
MKPNAPKSAVRVPAVLKRFQAFSRSFFFAFIATSKEADREHCEGLLIRGTDLPRNELRL